MQAFSDRDDEVCAAAATSFDRTVSYFLIAVGVGLGFLLMLATFLQISRVTAEPSRDESPFSQPEQSELGTAADSRIE